MLYYIILGCNKEMLCYVMLCYVMLCYANRCLLLMSYTVCGKEVFVAFVEDNATMNSIPYFENRVSHFVQNRRK